MSAVSNTSDIPQAFSSLAPSSLILVCCDSGSTNFLVRQSDATGIILTPNLEPISVSLPNGTTISATSCGYLYFPNLPVPIPTYIFPDAVLHTSLLSASEFCNSGCVATFTDVSFQITYNNLPVLCSQKSSLSNYGSCNFQHYLYVTVQVKHNATHLI